MVSDPKKKGHPVSSVHPLLEEPMSTKRQLMALIALDQMDSQAFCFCQVVRLHNYKDEDLLANRIPFSL